MYRHGPISRDNSYKGWVVKRKTPATKETLSMISFV